MRVEELFLRLLPGYCGLSCACDAARAVAHQLDPLIVDDLRFRNVADGHVVNRIANPDARHDDLLLLAGCLLRELKKHRPIIGMTPLQSRVWGKFFRKIYAAPRGAPERYI